MAVDWTVTYCEGGCENANADGRCGGHEHPPIEPGPDLPVAPRETPMLIPDAIPDPLSAPLEATLPPAVVRVIAEWTGGAQNVLFSMRASTPGFVLGATTDANCRHCGEAIWVSPSSRAAIAAGAAVLCTECLDEAVRFALAVH